MPTRALEYCIMMVNTRNGDFWTVFPTKHFQLQNVVFHPWIVTKRFQAAIKARVKSTNTRRSGGGRPDAERVIYHFRGVESARTLVTLQYSMCWTLNGAATTAGLAQDVTFLWIPSPWAFHHTTVPLMLILRRCLKLAAYLIVDLPNWVLVSTRVCINATAWVDDVKIVGF